MGNRVRLHSLIKSSSTNRTFSWMLISHLHLCSCVCPPHHYTSLTLLSSLLTCQPLRSLPSPSAASLLFHVVICHPLSKHQAPVLLKERLQEASKAWDVWERPAWANNSGPTVASLYKWNTQIPSNNIGCSRLHHVFMQPMTRCACLSVHMQADLCTSSWTSPRSLWKITRLFSFAGNYLKIRMSSL